MKKGVPLKLCFLLALLLIKTSYQKFLQFDSKEVCQDIPLTSLGVLISLSESDESIYESTLSPEERESYENIIDLKRSFASTMSDIPSIFAPEKSDYWKGINYLLRIFIFIAVFPALFIIFYLFMRFVCRKCTGPKKISQVNKVYRNLTWVIMIVSSLVTALLFAVVLFRSVSVGKNIETAFDFAVNTIAESETAFNKVNAVIEKYRKNGYSVADSTYMMSFKEQIDNYIKNTRDRTQQILDDDSKRTKLTAIAFGSYYFFIILAYLFFCVRLEKMECLISVILFFAIPGVIVLEGYNAKFFFFYGDICDSVHGALYENQFPVADRSLGYYYNCFPTDVKANLYNLRYKLYEKKSGMNSSDPVQKDLIDEFQNVNDNTFEKLFDCELVSKVIPKIEADFCKDSLDYMYSLILIMTWVVLTSLGVAIGARRLQVLIWKKRNEIESMIQNEEILY